VELAKMNAQWVQLAKVMFIQLILTPALSVVLAKVLAQVVQFTTKKERPSASFFYLIVENF
jgi:hypothetical protein